MLCAWTSAFAILLLPRRVVQPLVGRRRAAAACLSDDLIFFPSVESSLDDDLLFESKDRRKTSEKGGLIQRTIEVLQLG